MKFTFNSKLNAFVTDNYQHPCYADSKIINTAIAFSDKIANNQEQIFDILGDWSNEIFDSQVDMYWTILENEVVEFIPYKSGGIAGYVINFGGKMLTCSPEDGDVIYSEKDEAKEKQKQEKNDE